MQTITLSEYHDERSDEEVIKTVAHSVLENIINVVDALYIQIPHEVLERVFSDESILHNHRDNVYRIVRGEATAGTSFTNIPVTVHSMKEADKKFRESLERDFKDSILKYVTDHSHDFAHSRRAVYTKDMAEAWVKSMLENYQKKHIMSMLEAAHSSADIAVVNRPEK